MNEYGTTSTESSCGVGRAEKAKIPSAIVVAAPIRSKLCVCEASAFSTAFLTHTYARSLYFLVSPYQRPRGGRLAYGRGYLLVCLAVGTITTFPRTIHWAGPFETTGPTPIPEKKEACGCGGHGGGAPGHGRVMQDAQAEGKKTGSVIRPNPFLFWP